MTKTIKITANQFDQMGWIIEESDRNLISCLEICNDPERYGIRAIGTAANGEEFEMSDYEFDYFSTLSDLDDMNMLPDFLAGQRAVMYNDDENQRSAIVPTGDVSEIIGDIDRLELKLYGSFAELNADLSNCSFGHVTDRPNYETNEYNEI